jgi:hypothetical protein
MAMPTSIHTSQNSKANGLHITKVKLKAMQYGSEDHYATRPKVHWLLAKDNMKTAQNLPCT